MNDWDAVLAVAVENDWSKDKTKTWLEFWFHLQTGSVDERASKQNERHAETRWSLL